MVFAIFQELRDINYDFIRRNQVYGTGSSRQKVYWIEIFTLAKLKFDFPKIKKT